MPRKKRGERELLALLEIVGNQTKAGKLVDVNQRAVSNWLHRNKKIPELRRYMYADRHPDLWVQVQRKVGS